MDEEFKRFQDDLLKSVQQMKRGEASRTTNVIVSPAVEARINMNMSQREFAELLGVSMRTLQDWEKRRREPTGAARTLLKLAIKHPEVLKSLS